RKKSSKAEHPARVDGYCYADIRQNVRIKMTSREPANHGIDDSLTSPTDACSKHSLESYSLKVNKSARDDKNGINRVSRKSSPTCSERLTYGSKRLSAGKDQPLVTAAMLT